MPRPLRSAELATRAVESYASAADEPNYTAAGLSQLTIPALVERAARRFGSVEAVVTADLRWTFAELVDRAEQAARALVADGLEPGHRVAIWAPNIAEWVQAALGVHLAGGVLVPINTRYKVTEAVDVIARSRARMVLCVSGFLGTDHAAELAKARLDDQKNDDENYDLGGLERVVVLRGPVPDGCVDWQQMVTGAPPAAQIQLPMVAESDLSDIIFTSGTTGKSKGVVATHGQTVQVFTDWSTIVGLGAHDRYLIVNPFFHTFGYKAGIIACLIQGATMVPEPVFDVDTVLQRCVDESITMLPGPPALYLSILNHPDRGRFDLSSLRLAVTGAAAVPVEMIERMRNELAFESILTAYGLTESTGTVSMCRPGDSPETISATSGRAIPGIEIRLVDDDGAIVPRGDPGEICVRGYNVTTGYLEDPKATAAAITDDGWLHTGDIGVMNSAGYIDITDRKKDMFIVGGFNTYPAEIENTLLGHPAVAHAAVVGADDDRLGQVGHAYLVARPDQTIDPDQIIAWCRDRMANYKVPRAVNVRDALPTNASGKVLKHELY